MDLVRVGEKKYVDTMQPVMSNQLRNKVQKDELPTLLDCDNRFSVIHLLNPFFHFGLRRWMALAGSWASP